MQTGKHRSHTLLPRRKSVIDAADELLNSPAMVPQQH